MQPYVTAALGGLLANPKVVAWSDVKMPDGTKATRLTTKVLAKVIVDAAIGIGEIAFHETLGQARSVITQWSKGNPGDADGADTMSIQDILNSMERPHDDDPTTK